MVNLRWAYVQGEPPVGSINVGGNIFQKLQYYDVRGWQDVGLDMKNQSVKSRDIIACDQQVIRINGQPIIIDKGTKITISWEE